MLRSLYRFWTLYPFWPLYRFWTLYPFWPLYRFWTLYPFRTLDCFWTFSLLDTFGLLDALNLLRFMPHLISFQALLGVIQASITALPIQILVNTVERLTQRTT
ncbi:hypothetical protein CAP31_01310 [Sulfuriferula sp. AH1]|uniref:hypothetical protein n=1 Tax=Sulfuriferula sp. AH1 TaxID=1985873 RepID=UPI000B3B6374|nr:hypothetical protein [Sulfuriferula sp. AH1]ARU30449.1 hypothetical protein CAP31_01310 [Sulfuriferula sp. AH1]